MGGSYNLREWQKWNRKTFKIYSLATNTVQGAVEVEIFSIACS